MYLTSRAILLQKKDWKESSFIVTFLTDNNSKIDAIVYRVKKQSILFNEGSQYNIEYINNNSKLKKIVSINLYKNLAINKNNMIFIYSFIELIGKLNASDIELKRVFDLYVMIVENDINWFYYLKFLINLFIIEGVWLDVDRCIKCDKKFNKRDEIYWIDNEFVCSDCNLHNNGVKITKRVVDFFNWLIDGNYSDIVGKSMPFSFVDLSKFLINYIDTNYYSINKLSITKRAINKISQL